MGSASDNQASTLSKGSANDIYREWAGGGGMQAGMGSAPVQYDVTGKSTIPFRVQHGFVVVKPDAPTKSEHITLIEYEEPTTGVVVACGPFSVLFALGDRVLFSKYHGVEFSLNGENYKLLEHGHVFGVILDGAVIADAVKPTTDAAHGSTDNGEARAQAATVANKIITEP